MKYIITESRLTEFAINWLRENFSNLKKYPSAGYTILVDDNTRGYFSISPNKEVLELSDDVKNFFMDAMNMNRDEISKIILKFINQTYGYKLERMRFERE
jgi:hypothetical protein